MAGLRALAVICWAALAAAQVKVAEKSNNPATTTTISPKAASQNDPPPLKASLPADNPGQTRFAPGFGGNHDLLGLFNDNCQHCSLSNLQLVHHCCQTRRLCCSLLQTFPGQFPGQFTGVVGPAGFPGQVAPSGFLGAVGGKGGTCPLVHGIQSGFNRFNGVACVAECRNDFQCPGQMKCCPAGCSTVCRNPQGGGVPPILIQPKIKPGSCPPRGLLGFLGLRSGAAGANATSDAAATADPDTDARLQEQEDRKERRINRKERQERKRSRRSAARLDQEDRRERRRNRLGRVYGRVIRSNDLRERESRRDRQQNRKHRVFGRVIRSSGPDDYDRNKRRRFNRHEMTNNRVIRQAEPNQRFFLGNPFCQNQCFNDFDCAANLKCCSRSKNCNECLSPTFP